MKSSTKTTIALLIFVIALLTGRITWHLYFSQHADGEVIDGEAHLQSITFDERTVVHLDGEWDFYPNELLQWDEIQTQSYNKTSIPVPNDWTSILNGEEDSPYGTGTYHVQLHITPTFSDIFSLHLASVRSASAVYINDRLLTAQGTVSQNPTEYEPSNLPKTVSFKVREGEPIHLIIQVANFKDQRGAGIVRSIQFGSFEAIQRTINLSTSLQIVTGSFFYLLAALVILLRLSGIQDRRLMYAAFLLIGSATLLMMSSDQKVLHQWIHLSYDFSFRIVNMLQILLSFSLFKLVHLTYPIQRPIFRWIGSSILGIAFIFFIVSPLPLLTEYSHYSALLLLVAIVYSVWAFFKRVERGQPLDLFLVFALLSLTNHLIWWGYSIQTGVTLPHYPFDLLLAIIWIVATWFRYYIRLYEDEVRMTEALRKSEQLQQQLITATTNKLKHPLHNIMSLTTAVLQSEPQLTDDNRQDLLLTRNISEQMANVLNDLVDFIRLNDERSDLQWDQVWIQHTLPAIHQMLQFSMKRPHVTFQNELPTQLPAVRADRQRLVQIFYNLLEQAYSSTSEGTITVRSSVRNRRVYVTVEDTGDGISEAALQQLDVDYEHITTDGMSIHSNVEMGFAITRFLVELHGGTLQIESTERVGTTVTVDFPIDVNQQVVRSEDEQTMPEHLSFERPILAQPMSSQSPTANRRSRILIIEHDPIHARVLYRLLEDEPYELQLSQQVEEALQLIRDQSWDLIISDVMMPHMDGYAFTRHVRETHSLGQLPILLLTARSSKHDIQEGFRSGANDYVTKPIDPTELRARVRALTTTKRSMETSIEMEAAWLQAQIQPHFFFNTLNTILALQMIDEEKMQHVLQAFMDILQSKFKFKDGHTPITLEEELHLLSSYLLIERERFGERLRVITEMEQCDTQRVSILPLTLQPLVENAIRHGIMKRKEGGTIRISGTMTESQCIITIRDDGIGMEEEQVRQLFNYSTSHSTGIGVYNTHLRLLRKYGTGLHVTSTRGEGTTITITLPLA